MAAMHGASRMPGHAQMLARTGSFATLRTSYSMELHATHDLSLFDSTDASIHRFAASRYLDVSYRGILVATSSVERGHAQACI